MKWVHNLEEASEMLFQYLVGIGITSEDFEEPGDVVRFVREWVEDVFYEGGVKIIDDGQFSFNYIMNMASEELYNNIEKRF